MLQEIMLLLSRHPILSLTWITLLAAVIITTFNSYFSKIKEIYNTEATYLINKENAIIVDIRNRDEYRNGHLANSTSLLYNEIKTGHLGNLKNNKARIIIIICNNGHFSHEAAKDLNKAGFQHVMILKGGIASWNAENLPLVTGK